MRKEPDGGYLFDWRGDTYRAKRIDNGVVLVPVDDRKPAWLVTGYLYEHAIRSGELTMFKPRCST